MKLILTRHGETIGNLKKSLEGSRIHGKLSKKGLEQAKRLAKRLKDVKFDYVYSSDLGRAKQTTKEIMKYHKKIPIKFINELREIDVGDFSGKNNSEVDWNNPPKNLETFKNAKKRAKKALDKVYKEHLNGTILFVGHNGINKAFIAVILNKGKEALKKYHQSNTAVSIFDINKSKKHKVCLMNCTRHLEGLR